jgi:hypothetical protein
MSSGALELTVIAAVSRWASYLFYQLQNSCDALQRHIEIRNGSGKVYCARDKHFEFEINDHLGT